jgi:lysophospholipase L1-like esterase
VTARRERILIAATGVSGLCLGALYAWNLVTSPHIFFSVSRYYVLATCGLLTSLLLIASSYVLHLRRQVWGPRVLLLFGALGLFFSLGDLAVSTTVRRTFGSGGQWCIANWLWSEEIGDWNQRGFWERDLDPYYEEGPREDIVVAVIGDSFTVGQGLASADLRFTNLLEDALQASMEQSVAVLNMGVPGASTRSETRMSLGFAAGIQPDVIVIGYLPNDIHLWEFSKSKGPVDPPFAVRGLVRVSPMVSYMYCLASGPLSNWGEDITDPRWNLDAFRDRGTFAAHMRDVRILLGRAVKITDTVLFVLLPYPAMWANNKPLRDAAYKELLETAAKIKGVRTLSLAHIEDEHSVDWFNINPSDPHPSVAAHAAIADAIYPSLLAAIRGEPQP